MFFLGFFIVSIELDFFCISCLRMNVRYYFTFNHFHLYGMGVCHAFLLAVYFIPDALLSEEESSLMTINLS